MTGKDFDMLNEAYVNGALKEGAKPDYIDADGDGDKKEPMKKAFKDKKKKHLNKEDSESEEKDNKKLDEESESPFAKIMDQYEARLSSSDKGFSLGHKLNEEDGTSYKQPDEKVGAKIDKSGRPTDEVKADKVLPDSACEVVHDDLQEPKEGGEKNNEKDEKVVEDSINNSNKGYIMSEDKSIFDKLYEQVMGEDEDFELGLPGDDDLGLGDDLGDEGGDVTVTLSQSDVDCLKSILDQVHGDDENGEEELGDEEPVEAGYGESNEVTEEGDQQTTGKDTGQGKQPGHDPSDGGGKTTDPAADSLGGKSSGTGDSSVTDDETTTGKETGEGKQPGHTKAKGAGKPGSQAV